MIGFNARFPLIASLTVTLALGACGAGDFFGEDAEIPLPGERIAVLQIGEGLKADPDLADMPVVLPRPYVNAYWSQPGGNAAKALGHVDANDALTQAWSVSIGSGGDDEVSLLTQPLVVGDTILVLDSEAHLRALNAADGSERWHHDLRPDNEDDAVYPGGIVADAENVYAATGFGEAIAFSIADGAEHWRVRLPGPVRGAPAIADGRLFAVTLENRTIALSTTDGSRIWEHQGITEIASLLGGAAPAVRGSTVLVPYSSGQLFALRVETGRVVWVENLSSLRALDAISRLSDIRGNPVIDNDLAFAVSHAGRMAAIDMRSGRRVWERAIGSTHMPWVAGDYVFVTSLTGEVVALTRRDGRVRWVHRLPPFEDMEDEEDPIQYAGPVLVGDRLLIGSSDGFVYAISPYSGKLLGRIEVGEPIYVAPIVAGGTVYVLDNDAQLRAYR
ncbi:MAG: PQQ-binding-like beta-propeller repeat protein [Thalassobaculaceae bacterium]|nr:PQQ-binding-like beta-propeller repeat protein [Thalassobaculaceae bacterium]